MHAVRPRTRSKWRGRARPSLLLDTFLLPTPHSLRPASYSQALATCYFPTPYSLRPASCFLTRTPNESRGQARPSSLHLTHSPTQLS